MPPYLENAPLKTRLVIAISLIRMFIDGPLVSFKGSPTVSPITDALCASECLPTLYPSTIRFPPSIYFLALSQAPPVFEKEIAIYMPDTIEPARSPLTPLAPKRKPITIGERRTKSPGAIISLIDEEVDIEMH